MTTVLYANGDSLVFGMECLGDKNRDEQNKELAFPKHIATELGCTTYINNAYYGATNDFIFRTTIEDLIKLEKDGTNPTDVFVVVGWTSLTRSDLDSKEFFAGTGPVENIGPESIDHGIVFTNPTLDIGIRLTKTGEKVSITNKIIPFLAKYLWADTVTIPNQQAKITALATFLKSRGYKFLFVATCGDYQFPLLEALPNFYYGKKLTMYEWAITTYPFMQREELHWAPPVHKEYALLLTNHIRDNKLNEN
jgi:hypothetical protein